MNKILKKSLYLGLATLMISSVGTSVSALKGSQIHASQVSRLISKRNHAHKEAKYYNALTNRLNHEISRLRHHTRRSYHHYSKAFRQGYYDAMGDTGKTSFVCFTGRLVHNKQYKAGFIYGQMHSNSGAPETHRRAVTTFNFMAKEYHSADKKALHSLPNKQMNEVLKNRKEYFNYIPLKN